jgi:hypothetical protein
MGKPVVPQNAYSLHSVEMDISFGRYGSTYSNDTTLHEAPANRYYYYIEILEDDTNFTSLTPLTNSPCVDDGVAKTGVNYPSRHVIYGMYESFELATGSANAYKAPLTNWENWYSGIQQQGT